MSMRDSPRGSELQDFTIAMKDNLQQWYEPSTTLKQVLDLVVQKYQLYQW